MKIESKLPADDQLEALGVNLGKEDQNLRKENQFLHDYLHFKPKGSKFKNF